MLIHVPQASAHAWLVDDQTFPKVLLCLVTMPPVNKVVRDIILQSKDDWLVNSPDRPPPLLDFVTMRFNVAHHAMCQYTEMLQSSVDDQSPHWRLILLFLQGQWRQPWLGRARAGVLQMLGELWFYDGRSFGCDSNVSINTPY